MANARARLVLVPPLLFKKKKGKKEKKKKIKINFRLRAWEPSAPFGWKECSTHTRLRTLTPPGFINSIFVWHPQKF